MSLKILVSGDVNGNYKALFDRVSQVNKKAGPFHLLLVAGNFFPLDNDEEDIDASLPPPPAPIQTYILGPTTTSQLGRYKDLNGCEIGDNITYLGRSGVYNEASGLRIAYLSGTQYDGPTSTRPPTQFNFEDVKNLRIRLENEGRKPGGVDVLLTHQWPLGVESGAPTKPEGEPKNPSKLISILATALKPRYHFAGGGEDMNYERAPYRNHVVLQEQPMHCSRFISLAKVGNPLKKKWIYAFNVQPMSTLSRQELILESPQVTVNPYGIAPPPSSCSYMPVDTGNGVKTAGSSQFFYDTSYTGERQGRGRGGRGGGRGGKRNFYGDGGPGCPGDQKKPRPPPGPCWFCLASPEVEKHLVVSIGDHAYVTLAKGGLTPDHLLILPIGHYGSLVECPPEVLEDIDKFKHAMKKYFSSKGKEIIFYERNFRSPHLQVQVVPIPLEKTTGLKITCLDFAESEGIELQEFPKNAELFQMTRPGFPYFLLELPDGTKLFTGIKGEKGFPLQFGRELVASEPLLNCPDKVDWKSCKMEKEEEKELTLRIRKEYKPFDFTLG